MNTAMKWITDKANNASLYNGNELLITLAPVKKTNGAIVEFGQHKIELLLEGFWTPGIVLKENGEVFLRQKSSFWGSKTFFEFTGGNSYVSQIKNLSLASLIYSTADRKEILTYKLVVKNSKPTIELTIANDTIPAFELYCIMVLGYYTMRNIESSTDDTIFLLAAVS